MGRCWRLHSANALRTKCTWQRCHTDGFLKDQFLIGAKLFAVPLWLAGLIVFLRDRRYRMLAWMYLIPLALFFFAKGRGYYMAAAYPMLIAMGACAGERWAARLPRWGRRSVEAGFFTGLAVCGAFICALILPLASAGPLKEFALQNNGDLREQIGWPELVRTVAAIRDSLPPDQHGQLILVSRLSNAAAHHHHPAGQQPRTRRRAIHELPSRRAEWQPQSRAQRREYRPSRHLRLRSTAHTVAGTVAEGSRFRLMSHFTSRMVQ
jgi:hypothetical protein